MNAISPFLNGEADFTQLVEAYAGDALNEVESISASLEALQPVRLGAAGLNLLNALLPDVEGHPC